MADDPKTQDDSKLPKPVTVTGSAFESKDEDKEEEKVERR